MKVGPMASNFVYMFIGNLLHGSCHNQINITGQTNVLVKKLVMRF
jgi:hypothetical protein